jgi:hypothetical protein
MLILNLIFNLIDSLSFFVWSELIAIFINFYAILLLCKKRVDERTFLYNTKYVLITIIASSILEDLAWLLNVLKLTVLTNLNLNLVFFIIRLAWLFSVIQYQAFSLFIERLIPNQSKFLLIINRFTSLICVIYSAFFIRLILFRANILEKQIIETYVIKNITNIYMPVMILICLFFTLINLRDHTIPNDLRNILYIFALGLIGPTILVDTTHIYQTPMLSNNYSLVAVFALFIALATLYCIKKILLQPSFHDEL